MIATTVVVLLARNDHFACLWAGDSRAYLLRDGAFNQLSRDHSLVQSLVDSGAIAAEEADGHPHANVITRAVGADLETFELEKRSGRLHTGDRLLLCSDGLVQDALRPGDRRDPRQQRRLSCGTPGAGGAGGARDRQRDRRHDRDPWAYFDFVSPMQA